MTDMSDIFQIVDALTEEEKRTLLHYLQQKPEPATSSQPRKLDLHPGAITIGDDFNDDLPDEFWLGEI